MENIPSRTDTPEAVEVRPPSVTPDAGDVNTSEKSSSMPDVSHDSDTGKDTDESAAETAPVPSPAPDAPRANTHKKKRRARQQHPPQTQETAGRSSTTRGNAARSCQQAAARQHDQNAAHRNDAPRQNPRRIGNARTHTHARPNTRPANHTHPKAPKSNNSERRGGPPTTFDAEAPVFTPNNIKKWRTQWELRQEKIGRR
ncbi:hypothetical protein FA95DRAFT_1618694 [Auriscalpium vulgare]|uniref:Uncharacterized protein n=1 Tax=Auriscalpium vulgare TaxID=40419 RepID=A0ACB8S7Y5_9AGAM|nr:hypothetical protein FA95DRAFT_1618694 [Auriscalpium vulgare]